MGWFVSLILGIVGLTALVLVAVVLRHEINCFKRREWISAMFGAGLMSGCLLIAFACFAGIRFIL